MVHHALCSGVGAEFFCVFNFQFCIFNLHTFALACRYWSRLDKSCFAK